MCQDSLNSLPVSHCHNYPIGFFPLWNEIAVARGPARQGGLRAQIQMHSVNQLPKPQGGSTEKILITECTLYSMKWIWNWNHLLLWLEVNTSTTLKLCFLFKIDIVLLGISMSKFALSETTIDLLEHLLSPHKTHGLRVSKQFWTVDSAQLLLGIWSVLQGLFFQCAWR